MEDYIQIGFTKKTHGVAGEIKVVVEEPYEAAFLEADRVFLEIRGSKQPYFIHSVRGMGDLIVHFEDIHNREEALLLQSKAIFLPAGELPAEVPVTEPVSAFAGMLGYLIIDKAAGAIGAVAEILHMPQQEMAVVSYQGREVLIPLNEQFVLAVDPAQKRLLMDLPEGLLSL